MSTVFLLNTSVLLARAEKRSIAVVEVNSREREFKKYRILVPLVNLAKRVVHPPTLPLLFGLTKSQLLRTLRLTDTTRQRDKQLLLFPFDLISFCDTCSRFYQHIFLSIVLRIGGRNLQPFSLCFTKC